MNAVLALFGWTALISPTPAMAQGDVPDPVEAFLAAWNQGDAVGVGALCRTDAEYTEVAIGTVHHGPDGCGEYASLTFTGAPDFELETIRIVRDGHGAVAEWIMRGTHTGDWPGLPATGAGFSAPGVSVIETDGQRVRRGADYWDLYTLLQQLGALPETQHSRTTGFRMTPPLPRSAGQGALRVRHHAYSLLDGGPRGKCHGRIKRRSGAVVALGRRSGVGTGRA